MPMKIEPCVHGIEPWERGYWLRYKVGYKAYVKVFTSRKVGWRCGSS